MKSNKEILDQLFSTNYDKFLGIAKKLVTKKDNATDILHSCIVSVYDMTDDRINKILPYFNYYFINMIKYSCVSASSPYQQKNNKMNTVENWDYIYSLQIPEPETEDKNIAFKDINRTNIEKLIKYMLKNNDFTVLERNTDITIKELKKLKEKILLKLDKCSWYDRDIFLRYITSGKSFNKLNKELKIPAGALYHTYKKTMVYIINELKIY